MLIARYFRQTLRIAPGWATVVLASQLAWLGGTAIAAEPRGGIEIGSKGVKMTLVELGEKPGEPARVVRSAIVNTTIASGVLKTGKYSADAIQETASAAADLVNRLRNESGLGSDKIRVFASSGLPPASNRQDLIDAVSQATGLPPMEFITPCQEVQFTIIGLVPKTDWPKTVLVDIGSGNTKGGFIRPPGQGVCLSVPLGSVTFADRVTREAQGQPFGEVAERLRPSLIEAPLAEQAKSYPELAALPVVVLSGGAPYAMSTLMHPEAILKERVELTTQDIADYLSRLLGNPRLPAPDFTVITDPRTREAAEKEFGKVRDTFTRENLIAGAEILASLVTVLQLEGKRLVFDRTSATAWLRAILDPALAPAPTPDAGAVGDPPSPSDATPKARDPEKSEAVASPKPEGTPAPNPVVPPAPASDSPRQVFPSPQSPPVSKRPAPAGARR
jgi:hypothetical protein